LRGRGDPFGDFPVLAHTSRIKLDRRLVNTP
jgi:hypothetical protein